MRRAFRGRSGGRLACACALALASAVLAGCGSSSSDKASSSSSSTAGTSNAAKTDSKKVPYVLGVQGSLSGPLASTIGGWGPSMKAWAQWTNAHGGINGHQVKLIVQDDAGNPTTALSQVKQMVEQDHVIALVNASGAEQGYASYLVQKGIPGIGGIDGDTVVYGTLGNFFSEGTSPEGDQAGAAAVAKSHGLTNLAFMYCTEVPACKNAGEAALAAGKPLGQKSVYVTGISSSAPNYTAQCLAAKKASANGLLVSAATAIVLSVGVDCRQQGLKAPNITSDQNWNASWLKSPGGEGAVGSMPAFPWFLNSTPAQQEFHQAMQQYYPEVVNSPAFGASESSAWVTGQLFKAAAAKLGDSPTSKGVRDGLYALNGETLGGLAGPITYTQGKNPNVKLTCYFGISIAGGKFVAENGGNAICPK